jgi:nucleoside recognition membrane protein YjiH
MTPVNRKCRTTTEVGMFNIAFNLLITKGLETMPNLSKANWKVVGVAVAVTLIAIAVIANVDALDKPRDALGLDSGRL